MQLRQAAATARMALIEEAAKRLDAKVEDLKVADGVVSGERASRVTYGELIGGKTFSLKLDPKKPVKTKDPKDYKIVGKPVPRVDIPDKVTGQFTYMQDFRVPGMLHGRVVRPPAIGAKLESVDESSLKEIPGIVKVVREGNFLAVVAENEWAAIKAAQRAQGHMVEVGRLARAGQAVGARARHQGRQGRGHQQCRQHRRGAGAGRRQDIKATYDFAIHTHGSIGPSCAVAEFKDGKLTSWSASQATHDLRKQLAKMLALPAENVRCIYLEGSGCYGRNGHEDAAADAALLAKAVGKPVRVQWSRADEHGWDPKGPPTLIDLRASMDASGNVTAWESEFFIPQQTAGRFLVPLVAATLSGLAPQVDVAPGNVFQNSAIPYKFANVKTVCHRLETTPFRPSWIRTPGRMQNTYANECFIDELAAAANADPIEFRLKYLDAADKRGIEVLTRLAALAKWEKRPSPQKDMSGNVVKGRGVSLRQVRAGAHLCRRRRRGRGRPRRAAKSASPGSTSPMTAARSSIRTELKNQIEGNVIQTVSRTLMEEVKFDRSMVTSLDWASYPILTFPQVPEIVIELIDRPNEPWGAGEPAAAVVPSAISNAVFDATGVRLRSVPFTPVKLKAARAVFSVKAGGRRAGGFLEMLIVRKGPIRLRHAEDGPGEEAMADQTEIRSRACSTSAA